MSHPEIRVQYDAINAVIAAAQEILIKSAQPVAHGRTRYIDCGLEFKLPRRGPFFAAQSAKKRRFLPRRSLTRTVQQWKRDVTRQRAHRRFFGWLCRRGGRRLRAGCLDSGGDPGGGGSGCWRSVRRAVCGRAETVAQPARLSR